jgi:hypothetical protein
MTYKIAANSGHRLIPAPLSPARSARVPHAARF